MRYLVSNVICVGCVFPINDEGGTNGEICIRRYPAGDWSVSDMSGAGTHICMECARTVSITYRESQEEQDDE